MAELVTVLPVQPVQGVKRVQDLLLGHPGATQPLQQIYLLDGEARLLAELRHPAAGQKKKKKRQDRQFVRRRRERGTQRGRGVGVGGPKRQVNPRDPGGKRERGKE